jgi:hypothetical protein
VSPSPPATAAAEHAHHAAERARLELVRRGLTVAAAAAATAATLAAALGDRLQLLVAGQLDRLDDRLPLDAGPALLAEVAVLVLRRVLEAVLQQLLLEVVHLAARQIGDDAHVERGRRRRTTLVATLFTSTTKADPEDRQRDHHLDEREAGRGGRRDGGSSLLVLFALGVAQAGDRRGCAARRPCTSMRPVRPYR